MVQFVLRKWVGLAFLVGCNPAFAQQGLTQPLVNLGYAKFSADFTLKMIAEELEAVLFTGQKPQVLVTPIPGDSEANPLLMVPEDYATDGYLALSDAERTAPPRLSEKDARWYSDVVQSGRAPDVFIIGGHQVISNGWHDHEETRFMFLPTLFQTVETYSDARAYFDQVKFAVLGGCNTMTNLEPRKLSTAFDNLLPTIASKKLGDFLTPEEIRTIYQSGPAGKNFVIGKSTDPKVANRWNSLEFYRNRLATEYGPNNPEHYQYTRGSKNEKCLGPGKYDRCKIANVDRLFPDSGLWDGTHRYNYPWVMKGLFRNAVLVMGWTSASPNDDKRALITKMVLDQVRKEMNSQLAAGAPPFQNLLFPLISPSEDLEIKKLIISSMRRHWTRFTYENNRQRPSGSITPALPDIDENGIFTVEMDKAPTYAPYRPSQGGSTTPVVVHFK